MTVVPGATVANHLEVDVCIAKKDDAKNASISVDGLILDANLLAEDERL